MADDDLSDDDLGEFRISYKGRESGLAVERGLHRKEAPPRKKFKMSLAELRGLDKSLGFGRGSQFLSVGQPSQIPSNTFTSTSHADMDLENAIWASQKGLDENTQPPPSHGDAPLVGQEPAESMARHASGQSPSAVSPRSSGGHMALPHKVVPGLQQRSVQSAEVGQLSDTAAGVHAGCSVEAPEEAPDTRAAAEGCEGEVAQTAARGSGGACSGNSEPPGCSLLGNVLEEGFEDFRRSAANHGRKQGKGRAGGAQAAKQGAQAGARARAQQAAGVKAPAGARTAVPGAGPSAKAAVSAGGLQMHQARPCRGPVSVQTGEGSAAAREVGAKVQTARPAQQALGGLEAAMEEELEPVRRAAGKPEAGKRRAVDPAEVHRARGNCHGAATSSTTALGPSTSESKFSIASVGPSSGDRTLLQGSAGDGTAAGTPRARHAPEQRPSTLAELSAELPELPKRLRQGTGLDDIGDYAEGSAGVSQERVYAEVEESCPDVMSALGLTADAPPPTRGHFGRRSTIGQHSGRLANRLQRLLAQDRSLTSATSSNPANAATRGDTLVLKVLRQQSEAHVV
eukprot:gene6109-7333_t